MTDTVRLLPLVSDFHPPARLESQTEWLRRVESLTGCRFVAAGEDAGPDPSLTLVWVRTGGVERRFLDLFPTLKGPVFLLSNPGENSLAAALEILAWVKAQGREGEILQGEPSRIAERLAVLHRCAVAARTLGRSRFGVFGEPSDWLIASRVEAKAVKARWGARVESGDLADVLEEYRAVLDSLAEEEEDPAGWLSRPVRALREALETVIRARRFDGVTLRCFDLLSPLQETGCVPLALLNDAGLPAACEGDVPALFTMALGKALGAGPGFMANPAEIDPVSGEMILAHCTVPFSLTTSSHRDTHFESGLGCAVRGVLPPGPCTLARSGGRALEKFWLAGGELLENLARPDLCRTQVRVRLDSGLAEMLADPLGNHRVLFLGDHLETFKTFFRYYP